MSPENHAGGLNVSQTEAPWEPSSSGQASGRASFWHDLGKLFTINFGHVSQYSSADADFLIQFRANQ